MKGKNELKNNVVIYQAKSGALELRKDVQNKTIWATQAEMATLYRKDQSVTSRHIRSIFSDGEVDRKSNMQEMHIANSDKPIQLYSLDIVLAVGYRTNSQRAIEFRKWATKTLRQYIVDGYAISADGGKAGKKLGEVEGRAYEKERSDGTFRCGAPAWKRLWDRGQCYAVIRRQRAVPERRRKSGALALLHVHGQELSVRGWK